MSDPPHSILAEIEEAFGVLEKKHHPTWEIECVQATAELRAYFHDLFEQLGTAKRQLVTVTQAQGSKIAELQEQYQTLRDAAEHAEALLTQGTGDQHCAYALGTLRKALSNPISGRTLSFEITGDGSGVALPPLVEGFSPERTCEGIALGAAGSHQDPGGDGIIPNAGGSEDTFPAPRPGVAADSIPAESYPASGDTD